VGGSNVVHQKGTYGTEGIAAPDNIPGARSGPVSWTGAAGDFWLFGGSGPAPTGVIVDDLNDLWRYSAGEWTWMGGSNVSNQPGVYATEGSAAADNIPGGRAGATSWTDAAGNLWLFGGAGWDSRGVYGILNDLWKYSAGEWTWMSGSNVVNQPGIYATQGTPALVNVPGTRGGAVSWTDAAGNFWLFGGAGVDSTGAGAIFLHAPVAPENLDDLWKYEP
jgi:Galactose oxidase, central domain